MVGVHGTRFVYRIELFQNEHYKFSFPDQKTNLMTVIGVLKTNVDIENFKTKDDLIFFLTNIMI